MRWPIFAALAAFAALAGCSEHGHSVDALGDPSVCLDKLEATIDRACAAPSDCVLATHFDCCGNVRLGIHAGTDALFATAEAAFQTCRACPALGCAHPDVAEDGRTQTMTGDAIVAACVANRCTSVLVTP